MNNNYIGSHILLSENEISRLRDIITFHLKDDSTLEFCESIIIFHKDKITVDKNNVIKSYPIELY